MNIRLVTLILAFVLLMGVFSGCSAEGTEQEKLPVLQDTTEAPSETPAETPEEAPAETPTETPEEAPAETPEEAPVEEPVEPMDLEALYNQGVEVLAQMGDQAPVLFPETNIDYLNEFYPGLADIEMKQFYAGVAPVTNAPFEIILVEVANESDVQTLIDIFHARKDYASDDAAYPENAEAWLNNCKITSRGCYVFLAVLMDPCEIPSEFILD